MSQQKTTSIMPATGPPGKPILELVLGGRLTGVVLFTGKGGGLNVLAMGRKLLKIEGELVTGAMLPVKGVPPKLVFLVGTFLVFLVLAVLEIGFVTPAAESLVLDLFEIGSR